MTNKQIVKNMYKNARSRIASLPAHLLSPNEKYVIVFGAYPRARATVLAWGATPKNAWENAALIIKQEIVEKLSS